MSKSGLYKLIEKLISEDINFQVVARGANKGKIKNLPDALSDHGKKRTWNWQVSSLDSPNNYIEEEDVSVFLSLVAKSGSTNALKDSKTKHKMRVAPPHSVD